LPRRAAGSQRYRGGVFTKPVDVDDAQVGDALLAGWALTVDEIAYAAVGFGSYHWHVAADGGRWFVTVDDLVARRRDERETNADAGARLSAALRTARALRDAGLDFVVAAKPTHAGCIVHAIDERYVVALHRHVDGTTHRSITYADRAARLAVLDRLVAVHGASNAVADIALVDDLVIPARDKLADALDDSSIRWGPGPYAEGAHRLLDRHRQAVHRLMAHYDALVVNVGASREPMVVTHGEPHRANTIVTTAGVALIDWDTALLARRERDLWMLIDEDFSAPCRATSEVVRVNGAT